MHFQIRNFSSTDREFILSLVPRFSEFDLPAWRTKTEIDQTNHQSLLKAIEQPEPGSTILIAEGENGTAAGFIHLETQTDYFSGEKIGYISDIAVLHEFEGQGIGRLLLNAAEDWIRQAGLRLLTLYVFAGNVHAQRIYEKAGFEQEVIKYVKAFR